MSARRTPPHRLVSPGSTWGWVALACAGALAAAGGLAATGTGHNPIWGAVLGATAALLAVLALPSLPTRTAASLILALGGVVVVRHVRRPGSGLLLVGLWSLATLLALVLIDRAELDERPRLYHGPSLPTVARETVEAMTVLAVAVLLIASLLVPVLGHRPPARVASGGLPRSDANGGSASPLAQTDQLDTTQRPRLGNEVVMTVTAARPEFWRGQIFDVWNGRSWIRSSEDAQPLFGDSQGAAKVSPADGTSTTHARPLTQTFRIEAPYGKVVFAAAEPAQVEAGWLTEQRLDGSLFAQYPFGQGASYRVVSLVPDATDASLRAADKLPVPESIRATYGEQPIATYRVRQLAKQVTAGQQTTYDKVLALEAWMGAHTKYSLNAPLPGQGVDVVDDFLFHAREGWCEQISSSLVVMLRTLGISAREATGFVPGERGRLTDEFVVRARDAHAWAEVYFPGIGWQAFDPTAHVALAGDTRAPESFWSWIVHHVFVLILLALGGGALVAGGTAANQFAGRRRARRSRSWAARRFDDLERLGVRAGRARRGSETAPEYAAALAALLGEAELVTVGAAIDAEAFSPDGVGPDARTHADAVLAGLTAKR